jgi:hypothetical protein
MSAPLCKSCGYWRATTGQQCEACANEEAAGFARWQAKVDDEAHSGHYAPEWSTEQSHAGEFGVTDQFGEQRD